MNKAGEAKEEAKQAKKEEATKGAKAANKARYVMIDSRMRNLAHPGLG